MSVSLVRSCFPPPFSSSACAFQRALWEPYKRETRTHKSFLIPQTPKSHNLRATRQHILIFMSWEIKPRSGWHFSVVRGNKFFVFVRRSKSGLNSQFTGARGVCFNVLKKVAWWNAEEHTEDGKSPRNWWLLLEEETAWKQKNSGS